MDTFLTIISWYFGLGLIALIGIIIYVFREATKEQKPVTGEDLGGFLLCFVAWPILVFVACQELFKKDFVLWDPKIRAQQKKEKDLLDLKKKSEALEDQLDVIKEETKNVPWYKR